MVKKSTSQRCRCSWAKKNQQFPFKFSHSPFSPCVCLSSDYSIFTSFIPLKMGTDFFDLHFRFWMILNFWKWWTDFLYFFVERVERRKEWTEGTDIFWREQRTDFSHQSTEKVQPPTPCIVSIASIPSDIMCMREWILWKVCSLFTPKNVCTCLFSRKKKEVQRGLPENSGGQRFYPSVKNQDHSEMKDQVKKVCSEFERNERKKMSNQQRHINWSKNSSVQKSPWETEWICRNEGRIGVLAPTFATPHSIWTVFDLIWRFKSKT